MDYSKLYTIDNLDILIYILIFSLIMYLGYINLFNDKCDKNTNIKEEFDVVNTTDDDRNEINSYLKIFSKCLIDNKIPFWIIAGTLLGSVRHGEMIPWDDDADIGVFETDMEKILEMNTALNEYGYEIAPHWRIYKFKKIGQLYPFVDVFSFFESGDKYLMNHVELRNIWPNEYHDKKDLFPLKSYKFGELNLPGPNYPLSYLDRSYPGWQSIAHSTYDHKKEEKINEVMDLNPDDDEQKLKPYKIINTENKNSKNIEKFMRKKYNKYHNKKIVLFKN